MGGGFNMMQKNTEIDPFASNANAPTGFSKPMNFGGGGGGVGAQPAGNQFTKARK